jgi:drug/metabolite transporter (DMT)-like permease
MEIKATEATPATMPTATARPDRLTLAAFTLTVVLGGANAVAVRFSNQELPPFWGATLRFAAAALLLFAYVLARRLPLPRGRALAGVLIYGLLNFGVSYAFIYWGLVEVGAGLGQVALATAPLLTFLFAFLHGQEAFRWRVVLGGVLALAGIAVAFASQLRADVPLLPLLAMVAAAACFAEAAVIIKRFPRTDPFATNAVSMGAGAVLLCVISLIAGEAWSVPTRGATWLAVGYLVFAGSIAVFLLALYVLRRWTASATAYVLVLMPLVTVALAAWLLGERLTPAFVAGGLLALAGVWVGAIAQPRPGG